MKRRPSSEWSDLVELAAADLREDNRAFTGKNLFYAVRRAAARMGRSFDLDFEAFRSGPLTARLNRGPLPGLLGDLDAADGGLRLPREWGAYFPACILVVDRAELVPLFAASGVLVQARMAVVALDGRPAHVVSWLCRGLRAGHRAPIGYLHDAATVFYPFTREPLATWSRLCEPRCDETRFEFRDLGFPPHRVAPEQFGLEASAVLDLEEPPPHKLIAYVARTLLAMIPPDPMLLPLTPRRRRLRLGPSGGNP